MRAQDADRWPHVTVRGTGQAGIITHREGTHVWVSLLGQTNPPQVKVTLRQLERRTTDDK